jgi:hypothetical protein
MDERSPHIVALAIYLPNGRAKGGFVAATSADGSKTIAYVTAGQVRLLLVLLHAMDEDRKKGLEPEMRGWRRLEALAKLAADPESWVPEPDSVRKALRRIENRVGRRLFERKRGLGVRIITEDNDVLGGAVAAAK